MHDDGNSGRVHHGPVAVPSAVCGRRCAVVSLCGVCAAACSPKLRVWRLALASFDIYVNTVCYVCTSVATLYGLIVPPDVIVIVNTSVILQVTPCSCTRVEYYQLIVIVFSIFVREGGEDLVRIRSSATIRSAARPCARGVLRTAKKGSLPPHVRTDVHARHTPSHTPQEVHTEGNIGCLAGAWGLRDCRRCGRLLAWCASVICLRAC